MVLITNDNKGAFSDSKFIPASEALQEALILTQAVRGPVIEGDAPMLRIPYVSESPDAEIVGEGLAIDEKNPVLSEITVGTKKIGILIVVSREAMYAEGVSMMLTDDMRTQIRRKADAMFLHNTPTASYAAVPEAGLAAYAEPAGLVNTPGIVDGGNITDSINPLLETLGTLGDNGAAPSAIIMSYGTWAKLLQISDANGRPLVARDVANSPTPVLYGIPVILNSQAPASTLIIVDKTQIVASCNGVNMASSDQRYFERDSLGMRITMRLGWGVIRPNRIAKLTIGVKPTSKTK